MQPESSSSRRPVGRRPPPCHGSHPPGRSRPTCARTVRWSTTCRPTPPPTDSPSSPTTSTASSRLSMHSTTGTRPAGKRSRQRLGRGTRRPRLRSRRPRRASRLGDPTDRGTPHQQAHGAAPRERSGGIAPSPRAAPGRPVDRDDEWRAIRRGDRMWRHQCVGAEPSVRALVDRPECRRRVRRQPNEAVATYIEQLISAR